MKQMTTITKENNIHCRWDWRFKCKHPEGIDFCEKYCLEITKKKLKCFGKVNEHIRDTQCVKCRDPVYSECLREAEKMNKNVIGILVCNSKEVLEHKLNDGKKSENKYCYWEICNLPKRIYEICEEVHNENIVVSESAKAPQTDWIYDNEDILFPENIEIRLYFAVNGDVRGYFVCKAMGLRNNKYELRFYSESWNFVSIIPIKPSQGWRYFNHEEINNAKKEM